MDKDYLTLKRASASRSSGEWDDDDFDVLADGVVVGRIFNSNAGPVGSPWMWTLLFGYHEDRTPTHGYEPTREAAMAAFAKSAEGMRWTGRTACARSVLFCIIRSLARLSVPARGSSAADLRRASGEMRVFLQRDVRAQGDDA
jgi:hypothetical protein